MFIFAFALAQALGAPSASPCRAPSDGAIQKVSVPGRAWHAVSTQDGCWVFVSLHALSSDSTTMSGVAIVSRTKGAPEFIRMAPPPPNTTRARSRVFGLALTHDGRVLIAAGEDQLAFYDVDRLTSGRPAPLLGVLETRNVDYFHLALSADDQLLLVSNHRDEWIQVIDFTASRRDGFRSVRVIGAIPGIPGPTSIAVSGDGKRFYTTSQQVDSSLGWPNICRPFRAPKSVTPDRPGGAVIVIDAARAERDPAHAVIAMIPAGCDPARVAYSPRDDRLYVAARSDDRLLVFDAKRMVTDASRSRVGVVGTHSGPTGLALLDRGRLIAVANAVRFSPVAAASDSENVMIIDADGVNRDRAAMSVPSGGGPVDISVTPDGDVLMVANYEPRTLTLIPARRLRPK